ncbi:poly(U)-specific 3'-to-5' RNA exonuclease [Sporothrix curviconia]|uniref:U6 snRNA phosphodiesterase n=1 Tax=Sporothrix curviconia TaxID=1260050 RepID=A0ABP0BEK6_9PEZI
MGLVDYASSSDGDDDSSADDTGQVVPAVEATLPPLPPLPRAFHDLYAATVRTAPADDPALHQGRHRAIPHVAGQWPSHLYIEWFPSTTEHKQLARLLASLGDALGQGQGAFHSFLTSDLGAPLPLHISLSRPFVLTTANKAGFRADVTACVAASGIARFDVALTGLDWFRSPDSARSFLVLRATVPGAPTLNQPLVQLLQRCNEQVTAVAQPALYAKGGGGDDSNGAASAFHISVAWTLATDPGAWAETTQQVYEQWRRDTQDEPPLRIPVESIKAKIGNAVTDIPLRKEGAPASRRQPSTTKRARSDNNRSSNSDGAEDAEQPRPKRNLFGL